MSKSGGPATFSKISYPRAANISSSIPKRITPSLAISAPRVMTPAYSKQPQQHRYWRQRRRWSGYGAQGPYSQWAAGIQACLAQVVGPWVPQNGIVGPQTRRAVQIFQKQQQMPVTGMLDAATVAALQSACSGQAPAPQGPAPDAGTPPPPPAGPPAAAGPPSPPDAPDASGPEAAGEAEIATGELESETENELRVKGQCKVEIESHNPIPFNQDQHFQWAPDAPAVYVIYIDGKPWHVGVAEHNLRCHLVLLSKSLKNLNLPLSALKNRSVGWAALRSGSAPQCAMQISERGTAPSFHPVHFRHGVLRILKYLLSKKLETWNKGDARPGPIVFGPGGSLVIFENGKQIANLSPGNLL
jgi:hypothetical protein